MGLVDGAAETAVHGHCVLHHYTCSGLRGSLPDSRRKLLVSIVQYGI